ncbi:hypothetical protein GW17_00014013 [Ensete ventricosum]|nr:hypothetical protein GW17_00014013 [Ensete ventricosum]
MRGRSATRRTEMPPERSFASPRTSPPSSRRASRSTTPSTPSKNWRWPNSST